MTNLNDFPFNLNAQFYLFDELISFSNASSFSSFLMIKFCATNANSTSFSTFFFNRSMSLRITLTSCLRGEYSFHEVKFFGAPFESKKKINVKTEK